MQENILTSFKDWEMVSQGGRVEDIITPTLVYPLVPPNSHLSHMKKIHPISISPQILTHFSINTSKSHQFKNCKYHHLNHPNLE